MLDYLIITHLPSFYKVNLYNELAKKCRIHVIFVASTSSIRKKDFCGSPIHFSFDLLYQGDFETRNQFRTCLKLFKMLFSLNYKKLLVGGWDLVEFWLAIFVTAKSRNCLALESTSSECKITGIKGMIKRLFVGRIALGFPSGKLHAELFRSLGGQNTIITRGVGIFNYLCRDLGSSSQFAKKFLYVGRLSPEKNLLELVRAFEKIPTAQLTIVGSGPLESQLKKGCPQNVAICPYVENNQINKLYSSHDVLILPSLAEPWGLVVDEALYYGLPVIVSNRVGCHHEVVKHTENGLVYEVDSFSNLLESIRWMMVEANYVRVKESALHFDFKKRDTDQVEAYLQGLAQ